MSDSIVLSFHDTLLRHSDVNLLKGPHWLNDNIISFYYQYLNNVIYKDVDNVLFITCEVTQCLKMVGHDEISIFLDPLEFLSKDYVFFALNNNESAMSAGGSHWSMLAYVRRDRKFYHFDSMNDINYHDAALLAKKISHYAKDEVGLVSVSTPTQNNGYDCGIHVLCNTETLAKYVSENKRIDNVCLTKSNVTTKRSELMNLIIELSNNA